MLAIYFEEVAAHHHTEMKEAEAHRDGYPDSDGTQRQVVLRLVDDDEDDEDE